MREERAGRGWGAGLSAGRLGGGRQGSRAARRGGVRMAATSRGDGTGRSRSAAGRGGPWRGSASGIAGQVAVRRERRQKQGRGTNRAEKSRERGLEREGQ